MDASLHGRSQRGFTLLELLVVLSIIGMLTAISVTSIQKMMHSTDLTSSAATVVEVFNLARQRAISNNRPVEVRIYKIPPRAGSAAPNLAPAYRALGIYQINEEGPQLVDKLFYLSGNTEFSESDMFGTLLRYSDSGTALLRLGSANASYDYHSFLYHPDGSTSLNAQPVVGSTDTWHVMIYNSNHAPTETAPPVNYVSIQLDPVSGRTETFQPGM